MSAQLVWHAPRDGLSVAMCGNQPVGEVKAPRPGGYYLWRCWSWGAVLAVSGVALNDAEGRAEIERCFAEFLKQSGLGRVVEGAA
jgi:hypothetical protein